MATSYTMTPERTARFNHVLNNRQPDLTVVMENVHDPHNVAAIMRTCDAVGVQEIYVLNNKIGRHERFGKKSSATAAAWLTVHVFDNTEACFEALRKRHHKIYATHLGEQSYSLYELNLSEPVALVFGNEHEGITDEALRFCDGNFIIPQVGMVRSLNVSVACAVTLYEAHRQRLLKGLYGTAGRLDKATRDALWQRWENKKAIME